MADGLLVAAGMEIGAGCLRQRACPLGIEIGDRQKADRRMLAGQPRCPSLPGD